MEITGKAKWENTAEGAFVTYKGQRYKSTAEEPIFTTGCASAVNAADWDGDGDLDLLVGEISGAVQLIPNEGTAGAISGCDRKKGRGLRGESLREAPALSSGFIGTTELRPPAQRVVRPVELERLPDIECVTRSQASRVACLAFSQVSRELALADSQPFWMSDSAWSQVRS
jgi:hypothetical protein